MSGLFATLNLGTRSLQTQQAAVEITGQNLANVNNPAYARQRIAIQSTVAISTPHGLQGTGAQVVGIEQLRNALLDGQIREEASLGGYWSSFQSALYNAQSQLGNFLNPNASGISGNGSATDAAVTLADQLNVLFNAFQAVATNPASLTDRQALANHAQSLAISFNQAATNLTGVQNLLNASLSADVGSANQLLTDIASLNDQIVRSEMSTGSTANDLRDLRQQKLEEISKLVTIQTGTDANGALTISIDGTQVVAGHQVLEQLETYDAGGGQLLVRSTVTATPLTLAGGSMQGTIDARDGALQNLRNDFDSLAATLVSQVNAIYSAGYDLNGNTGDFFFTGTDAATIGLNAVLLTDPSRVQAAGVANAAGDNAVALALAQLARQTHPALGNQTFAGAHAAMVANLGSALGGANAQVANFIAVNSMLLQQRDSISGVSLDEEMANLLSFQKAYAASAKIVTTVDQMLETVLTLKR